MGICFLAGAPIPPLGGIRVVEGDATFTGGLLAHAADAVYEGGQILRATASVPTVESQQPLSIWLVAQVLAEDNSA
jgi:hypothetical protein